jgi:hypothetical protein
MPMPIYDIFDAEKVEAKPQEAVQLGSRRDRIIAFLAARLFFLFLLVVDCGWALYSLFLLGVTSLAHALALFKSPFFKKKKDKAIVSVKRSSVCGLALVVALFSPAFGMMVACTYFLMYDKAGIEEVVPASLQDQFKQFFN